MTPKLNERILEGINMGMDRQRNYAKDLLKIRPEYLLTVSVADAIILGFDGISGLDVRLRLEAPTAKVRREIVLEQVKWNEYFQSDITPVSRSGFVDIFVQTPTASYVVELKNIDPSSEEIAKEVVRLGELLLVNNGNNHCETCHIGFPTCTDEQKRIGDTVGKNIDHRLSYVINETRAVVTGEDPEDGLPTYFPNCVTIWRTD